MKFLKTLILLTLFIQLSYAQQISNTEQKAVNEVFSQKYLIRFQNDKAKAEAISKATGIPLRVEHKNGEVTEFARFGANGEMIFNRTNNIGSGRTISTNKVWPGGTTGTSLTGSGMSGRLGIWDGGAVLTSHQELASRVNQVDGASPTIQHSTHVAGTMIGTGITANAKGMAYQANLSAYDWTSDISEMTTAAGNGMLLSNHSYGAICGWYQNPTSGNWQWYGNMTLSTTKDYKYGFYDQQAADFDYIARNNPNYLICKAAGNDRGSSLSGSTWYYQDASFNWVVGTGTAPPAVGPYDCMEPSATAKNILTVGAVVKIGNSNTNNGWTQTSDVVMTTFSGWGPTDDGRIKPDVVAAGKSIYSTSNTSATSYATLDGTSMATPAVTGSLLLVQQHYNNKKGVFMKSATLKGLAIHTADEAGNIGPDYTYGWGLLNTSKAVLHINDTISNQIKENTLANGATYTQVINSDGTKPLRLTICWTDLPANTSMPAYNDTTKKLVNDLDIRLKRNSDNTIFMPYILFPASPSTAATTGDNRTDNVEQIYLSAPTAGAYTVIIYHKGTLASAQPYSLLISGIAYPPIASFTQTTNAVCSGTSINFTDNSSGSPTSRKWYFPGGTPSSSVISPITITYNTPGKYSVALTVTNLLGTDSTYTLNSVIAGGYTTPFNETFESNSTTLNSWTKNTPVNDTAWRLTTVAGSTPGNQAYFLPFFNYAGSAQRDGLITPTLNLSGLSSASLTFQHAYTRFNNTTSDSLIVYVSTNCGTTWTRLTAFGENNSGSFATAPNNTYLKTSYFTPAATADWCGGGVGSSCKTINLTAYAGMNNIKIKFEGYNNNGNNMYIDNVNVSGTPLTPVANFTVSKTSACVGEPINFSDSSKYLVTNWQWTFNGAQTTSSTSAYPSGIIYSKAGTYSVTLKVSNISGSDSITKTNFITINGLSIPTVTANKALTICSGDTIKFTCDSTATTYKWYQNGYLISGATAKTYSTTIAGSYLVKIGNGGGCETPSLPNTVIVNPPVVTPSITSTIPGSIFCSGGSAILTSNSSTGNQWYKNGVALSGQTNASYTTGDSGSYTVVVTQNGCKSAMSAAKVYGLLPKPAPISISGVSTTPYGDTVIYSVTKTTGSNYSWSITHGTQISGTTTNQISVRWNFDSTGIIQVIENGSNGCQGDPASLNIKITPHTGIANLAMWNSLKIYPNPAQQFLNIEFENLSKQQVQFTMINTLGQKIFEQSETVVNGFYTKHISLADFAKGIYFLQVNGENGSRQIKIVVE